jgi:hypothetical protein
VSSATCFSNLLEDKNRRLKIELTLSLILHVNLRLGGYSIWSASLIAPHIKEDNYSRHEHLTASMQSRKYSKDTFKMKFGELEDAFRSTRTPAVVGYEELGGLSDPGTRACTHRIFFLDKGWDMVDALHLL